MATPAYRARTKGPWAAALALLAFALAGQLWSTQPISQVPPSNAQSPDSAANDPSRLALTPLFTLQLAGNSPALAWSPDSTRLAFAQVGYLGMVETWEPYDTDDDVFLYDRGTGATTAVVGTYDTSLPRWHEDGSLSVVCSVWRQDHDPTCDEGIRVVLPTEGSDEGAPVSPAEARCRDDATLTSYTNGTTGLWIESFGAPINVDATPAYWFDDYIYQGPAPLEACLSPDGTAVAYVTNTGELRVYALPPIEDLMSAPSLRAPFAGREVALGLDEVGLAAQRAACWASGSRRCSEERFEDELTLINVPVDPFELEVTEVNRAQYQRCVDAGACQAIDESMCSVYDGHDWVLGTALPAESLLLESPRTCVTRDEAAAYCGFVGGRLPREAEWFAAAAGPEERLYPWGNGWVVEVNSPIDVRYLASEPAFLDPAYSHFWGSTPEGLRNMAGNAYEWVADSACAYADWPTDASECLTEDSQGVVRGGSFLSDSSSLRNSHRRFMDLDARVDTNGFRCAFDASNDQAWCDRVPALAGIPYDPRLSIEDQCFVDDQGAWGAIGTFVEYDADNAERHLTIVRVGPGVEAVSREALSLNLRGDTREELVATRSQDLDRDGLVELILEISREEDEVTVPILQIFTLGPVGGLSLWPAVMPPGGRWIARLEDLDGDARTEAVLWGQALRFDHCFRAPPYWSPQLVARQDDDAGLVIDGPLTHALWARECAAQAPPTDLGPQSTTGWLQGILCDRISGGTGQAIIDDVTARCASAPTGECLHRFACDNLDAFRHAASMALPQ